MLTSLLVVVGVVVITLFRSHADQPVPASCATAALAVPAPDVAAGGPVTAVITGPANGQYVLALDATSVTVAADRIVTQPASAVVLLQLAPLVGCRQERTVGLPASVGTGRHVLGLFRTGPGGRLTPLQTVTLGVS